MLNMNASTLKSMMMVLQDFRIFMTAIQVWYFSLNKQLRIKNMLAGATGLNNDELNKALQNLTKGLFIRFTNHEVIPTERFRLGVTYQSKHCYKKVG